MKKKFYFLLIGLLLGTFPLTAIQAQEPVSEEPEESEESTGPVFARICKSEILMEADSGDIIFENNADEPLPPASMVKLMVVALVMQKVEEGVISLDDIVTTSAFASKIGGSQVYLKEGEQFTVEQMIEAVMIQSANDAAVALAEHIGGSAAGFVDMMNAESARLGLKNAVFHSPHGLPPDKSQKPDMVSARDLAMIARHIVTRFPQILDYSKLEKADFRDGKFIMTNTNRMVKNYPGCDGLKTGFYQEAGFCVAATAQRNGVRMIAVVMGCDNSKKRFEEAARLLSLGFSKYKIVTLIKQGTPSKAPVAVVGGVKKETIPIATQDVSAVIRIEDENEMAQKTSLYKELKAPVSKEMECGYITFFIGEKEIGRVTLITQEEIPALGFWGKTLRLIGLK